MLIPAEVMSTVSTPGPRRDEQCRACRELFGDRGPQVRRRGDQTTRPRKGHLKASERLGALIRRLDRHHRWDRLPEVSKGIAKQAFEQGQLAVTHETPSLESAWQESTSSQGDVMRVPTDPCDTLAPGFCARLLVPRLLVLEVGFCELQGTGVLGDDAHLVVREAVVLDCGDLDRDLQVHAVQGG
jgi:hypothetical protein